MSARLALQICTYLLVVDGLAALALARLIEPAWWAVVVVVVAGSWWQEAVRARVAAVVRHQQLLALAALGFFALDLLYLADSLLDGFMHLLLFLFFYKLYTWRTLRDSRDLLLLSFFMLVGASTLTVSLGFLLILVLFLVLGTWAFLLHHVLSESERNAPDPAQALLECRQVVTPSLLGLSVAASFASFLFTALFFFVMPRLGQAVLPSKGQLGAMVSGFSDRVELGSFGTIQTDATVVMRVEFPEGPAVPQGFGPLRWRGVAFDRFNGREWSMSRPERRVIPRMFDRSTTVARGRGVGPVIIQEIDLEPIGTEVLFAAPRVLALTLSAGPVFVDSLGAVSSPVPQARLHYRVLSELEVPWPGTARALPEEERERHLQLPSLSPRIHQLARELTRKSPDQWTAALRLRDYLHTTFRYSLDLKRASGLEPLEDFFFASRSGNCEYFAAGLAVMLRSLGIPARVVNGFQQGEWNPYGGYFLVRQRDAHSWVEAYFPERGWVSLDPSPRGEFDASWASSAAFQYIDAVRMRWHRYVVNWSFGDQIKASGSMRQAAVYWRRAVFDKALPVPGGKRGAVVGAVLAGVLVVAILVWRRSSTSTPSRSRRGLLFPVYEMMLRRLARLGLSPGRGETAREFCGRVAARLPQSRDAVLEITCAYEEVRFGGVALRGEQLARLGQLAERLTVAPAPASSAGPRG